MPDIVRSAKSKPFIVGVGELLWDLLPCGKQLGGAPGNFVHHACQLGADALLISRVGNDPLGREALNHVAKLGLPTVGISVDSCASTGIAAVSLDADGKPMFTIQEPAAWDFVEVDARLHREVSRADAVCFGTLGQRHSKARAAVRVLVSATLPSALRIFDINLRQAFWSPEIIRESMQLANVVKLNDEELPIVARALKMEGDESSLLRQLAERFGLRVVALTKGADGSVLTDGKMISRLGTCPQNVVDTVGAGDAFTAALAVGLLRGCDLPRIQKAATEVAAYVCSCPGATPKLPAELCTLFGEDRLG